MNQWFEMYPPFFHPWLGGSEVATRRRVAAHPSVEEATFHRAAGKHERTHDRGVPPYLWHMQAWGVSVEAAGRFSATERAARQKKLRPKAQWG